jgi:hypothetical protein
VKYVSTTPEHAENLLSNLLLAAQGVSTRFNLRTYVEVVFYEMTGVGEREVKELGDRLLGTDGE